MKNKVLFCILGEAGAGKDTIARSLSKVIGIPLLVSHTSRPMRTGEVDGVNYHFIPEYIFDDMDKNNEFLETTSYNIESEGVVYKYGYSRDLIYNEPYGMVIVNPHGLKSLMETDLNIVSIKLERNPRDRMLSYLMRDENANVNELIDRWKRDERDFKSLVYDYIIYNNTTIEDAIDSLKEVINGELEDIKYIEELENLLSIKK